MSIEVSEYHSSRSAASRSPSDDEMCYAARVTRLRANEAEFVRPADVDPDAIVSVFRVPPEVAGMRLDLF